MKPLFLLLCCVAFVSALGALELERTEAPGWVQQDGWSPRSASPDAEADYENLLQEFQVNLPTNQQYVHYAFRYLTSHAVQDDSTVRLDYAPDYQSIKLHTLNLWRDGKAVDQRGITFQDLQREKGLEESMFDGERSWVGFLKDVRPGDVLEVAFTLNGNNPIFGQLFADSYHLQGGLALDRWKLRLLSEPGKTPQIRTFNTKLKPTTQQRGALEETILEAQDLEGILWEDRSPDDSDPASRIVLSHWKTWSQVVNWAVPLYASPATPLVAAKARELTAGLVSPEEKLIALLQYVQDRIRYLGIEVGINSHLPHAANECLQNGFGDCKDKAVLFCSLAASLGLEAWPVLVDTRKGKLVQTDGPSPLSFNHVIAAVPSAQGTVFIDPTADHQGGPLNQRSLGPYVFGLEIKPGVTELTALPGASDGLRELVQTYNFTSYDKPASVTMEYRFTGTDADWQRNHLEGTTAAAWRKTENDWLHSEYGDAKIIEGPTWVDDRKLNEVKIRYVFQLKGAWSLTDGAWKANFYPSLVGESLYDPKKIAERVQPYHIEFPETVRQETRILLPKDWKGISSSKTVSGPGFRLLSLARSPTARQVIFTAEYQTSADRVEAKDWTKYLETLKKARFEAGWNLSQAQDAPEHLDTDYLNTLPKSSKSGDL